uniref:CSON003227 protein n=1 Tax=Culicoides sonorensis TaxID=179676 RepID=A0A336LSP1_CULSO
MSRLTILFILISFIITTINASRILCYFPNPSKSHVILAMPICEELANRGHIVTSVTNFKFGKNSSNFKNIVVPRPGFDDDLFGKLSSGDVKPSPKFLMQVSKKFREDNIETLKSPEFQKIMKEETFDLIFFIPVFFNNVQLGIADHFKTPWVGLTPMGNILPIRQMLGSHTLPATVPNFLLHMHGKMGFPERVKNFLFNIVDYGMTFYMDTVQKSEYEQYFPSNKYRSYDDMKKNMSLIFLNSHFADSEIIRPLLPNEIEIGGIQIKTKPAPLEGELKQFLDNATNGAILWTFGTNLPVSSTQPAKVDVMLKVLSKIKEKVVVKWESDDLSRLPKNILGQKWLPQDSILAHPNVKLFIGHGGLGGVGEAKYHQVPILGMPFFGDQDSNMAKIEEEGWGKSIKLNAVTEENFSALLNDMLTNEKYQNKVKTYSAKYRDRIASALDTAVFWVEYVLKHHGAPHLQYPGKELNFLQRNSLDVIGLFAVIFIIILKFLTFLFGIFCGKKSTLAEVKLQKKKN